MAERTRCEICDREFKDSEGLAAHNSAKHLDLAVKPKKILPIRKIRNWSLFIVAFVVIIVLIVWSISSIERLPPIDMDGHVESNPVSHILKEPMPIAIQKHMLEHADGKEGGRAGVIINYNCKDYECESDLIGNLETFATKYDYVYVAPFKGMNTKIALTKLGKIDVMEEFNNETIERFILY